MTTEPIDTPPEPASGHTARSPSPAAVEPSILIVDDDPGTIQVLGRMLAGLGRLRFATGGEDALRLAREAVPDLLLLDDKMPGMSGFAVCQAMKADPLLVRVPVIFVTSHREADFEVQALRLGAVDFIAKPMVAEQLRSRVRARLRDGANLRRATAGSEVVWIPAAAPTRVLIVDADTTSVQFTRIALSPMVASVQFAARGVDALRMMAAESINLVLLDTQLPDIDGFEVLQRMQADPELRHITVVVLTRQADDVGEARALDLGAADYIARPYTAAVLQARVRSVLRLQRQTDAALRSQREQWQRIGVARVADIVAGAPDAIVSLDAAGCVVLINAAACRLLVVSAEQAIGAPGRQILPEIDALAGSAAPDSPTPQRRHLEAAPAVGRPHAIEVTLWRLGEGADQVTTLMLRETSDETRHPEPRA